MQGICDGPGNLRLNVEQVVGSQFPIVNLGPEVGIALCVDELHVDAYSIAGPLHGAFHHGRDAEFAPDVGDAPFSIGIAHDRRSRDNVHVANF